MGEMIEGLKERFTPLMLGAVFKGVDLKARLDPGFRKNVYIDTGRGTEPWNAKILFRTRDNKVCRHVVFEGGRVRTGRGPVEGPDVSFVFRDMKAMKNMVFSSPESSMDMLLRNDLVFEGNMAVVTRLSYILERITGKKAGQAPQIQKIGRGGSPR